MNTFIKSIKRFFITAVLLLLPQQTVWGMDDHVFHMGAHATETAKILLATMKQLKENPGLIGDLERIMDLQMKVADAQKMANQAEAHRQQILLLAQQAVDRQQQEEHERQMGAIGKQNAHDKKMAELGAEQEYKQNNLKALQKYEVDRLTAEARAKLAAAEQNADLQKKIAAVKVQELKDQITQYIRLLSDPEVRAALGEALAGLNELEKTKGANALALSQHRWSSVKGMLEYAGDGLKNFTNSPTRMALTACAIAAIIAAAYGAPILWRYLESILVQPRIVAETSLKTWFGDSKNQQKAAAFATINDVIVDDETKKQLTSIATRISLAHKRGHNLFNVLLHGEGGTGKTMSAKALAYHSGLDYAIMSGTEFAKIKDVNIAIKELQKLFRWAENSPKGMLIFIDEAESFLSDRMLPTTQQDSIDKLNALLARVEKPTSKKIMFVFATNHPFKLEKVLRSRIGCRVEFKMPAQPECEKILRSYLKKYCKEMNVVIDQACDKELGNVATELVGLSPRTIEFLAESMVQQASQVGRIAPITRSPVENDQKPPTVLTKDITEQIIATAKKTTAEDNKWDAEQQQYIGQLVAAHAT